MPNAPPPKDKVVLDKPTFCGTITEARVSARDRRERKPQPWAVRKLMVLITLGIMGYTAYVYAGRFAVRLMNGGRRPEGIGLLVGWSILYAWMLWAYIKVISTPPGNARDYVSQSPQPLLPPQQWGPHDAYRNGDGTHSFEFDSGNASFDSSLADIETGRIGGPAYAELPAPPPPAAHGSAPNANPKPNAPHAPNGASPPNGELPPPATARRPSAGRRHSSRSRRREEGGGGGGRPRGRLPPPAPLLPAHRYCARCSIVKPYRAHHCRVCGTCILKFDHHCPWIGQCVGARNHKFFLAFAYATAIFTIYTFGSLLAFNVRGGGGVGETDVDPQEVVIIALAALFALFTLTLGAEHTRLILLSQTTVESLGIKRLKERDSAGLEAAGLGCLQVRAKRRALASYDAEWGAPDTEGNVWWAGSARAGWEDAMGKGGRGGLGWVFPIGAPLGDGLHYVPNPRFAPDGRPRQRAEWPEELR